MHIVKWTEKGKETETEWNGFVRGEKLAESISMSLVSIHRNTSIFYGLWHYFFNKIRNLPCFVSWPKCCKSMSRTIYFLIYKVLWLLSYLIYKFLGISHKFSLPGFQKLFCILIFGIRFLYNSFCEKRINWCWQIFWNQRSRPINIRFYYSKPSLRFVYICQISIPNKELSIASKITRECLNNTSKV